MSLPCPPARTHIFDEQALANAGIKPSSSKTYEFSDVKNALAKLHDGYEPTVSCRNGALSEVWYFYNVQGNAIDGEYKATDSRKVFFLYTMVCFKGITLTTLKCRSRSAPALLSICRRIREGMHSSHRVVRQFGVNRGNKRFWIV